MLAVVHHLRVTEGVPVAEQFDAVAAITRRHLLVEYVPVTDPMFAAIARGREPLYPDCLRPEFEATLLKRFQIERRHELSERTRALPRPAPSRLSRAQDSGRLSFETVRRATNR